MNLKVGGGNFFGRASPLFWPKSTISRFGERFRDGQYSLASFLFAVHGAPPVPCGVGATVCGYALGGSDTSLTLTALTRLFGSGLPHTSVLCFDPFPHFLKTHRICINLKTGLGAGWGGGSCPRLSPVTTLIVLLR